MRLTTEQSNRLRNIVKVTLAEANLIETNLAEDVAPWIAPPTLNRILSTDQSVSIDQAEILIHAVSVIASLQADRLMQVIMDGFSADHLAEYEQAIATIIPADSDEVFGLIDDVEEAQAASNTIIALLADLPPWMLEEELTDRLINHRAQHLASDLSVAKSVMKDAIDRRRRAFAMNIDRQQARLTLEVRLSGLVRLVKNFAPFRGSEHDLIQSSFDSLVHDAILERCVGLAVINDIAPGPARAWARTNSEFPTIWLFDRNLLLKRRRGTLAIRVIQASSDQRSDTIFDHHAHELAAGLNYTCHAPTRDATINFINEFLLAAGYSSTTRLLMN